MAITINNLTQLIASIYTDDTTRRDDMGVILDFIKHKKQADKAAKENAQEQAKEKEYRRLFDIEKAKWVKAKNISNLTNLRYSNKQFDSWCKSFILDYHKQENSLGDMK
jgi:hypothetical protein